MLTLPAVLIQSTPLVALMPVIARPLGYDERTAIASAVLFGTSESRFDTAAAWAACLVATFVSVAAFLAARRLERAACRRFHDMRSTRQSYRCTVRSAWLQFSRVTACNDSSMTGPREAVSFARIEAHR